MFAHTSHGREMNFHWPHIQKHFFRSYRKKYSKYDMYSVASIMISRVIIFSSQRAPFGRPTIAYHAYHVEGIYHRVPKQTLCSLPTGGDSAPFLWGTLLHFWALYRYLLCLVTNLIFSHYFECFWLKKIALGAKNRQKVTFLSNWKKGLAMHFWQMIPCVIKQYVKILPKFFLSS